MGHEFNKDKPFYFQIDPNISIEKMAKKIIQIKDTPIDKLEEMSYNSKEFFECEMRKYFKDPTLRLIEWLRENEK